MFQISYKKLLKNNAKKLILEHMKDGDFCITIKKTKMSKIEIV